MAHQLLKEFTQAFSKEVSDLRRWDGGSRRGANLLEVTINSQNVLLYVKASTSKKGFWGLTRNQIERLSNATSDWYVVLLNSSHQAGYAISGTEIERRISLRAITLSIDGDYKINEPADVNTSLGFAAIDELVSIIERRTST